MVEATNPTGQALHSVSVGEICFLFVLSHPQSRFTRQARKDARAEAYCKHPLSCSVSRSTRPGEETHPRAAQKQENVGVWCVGHCSPVDSVSREQADGPIAYVVCWVGWHVLKRCK